MTVPSYEDMMLPMLRLIAEGNETIASCIPKLISEFRISSEEQQIMLPSGKQTRLNNRAHWSRQYLSQAGLVEPTKRGHYRLTTRGEAILSEKPSRIDNDFLKKFSEFREFKARSTKNDAQDLILNPAKDEETPEGKLQSAMSEINDALTEEVLSAVQGISSVSFEQLIVDLLVAMGYGGGDASMGTRIGKSGDGGIDGVINEDALGLDAVYVQAKRYSPDNKVGRPALQAFVGSLTGEGANKGVFVTTSDFSKEAREYVDRVQQRIIMINGERLARLMITYEVGVRARQTYVLKEGLKNLPLLA
ncbi:MAG: restriction endonuclease [Albidovulum sp.]